MKAASEKRPRHGYAFEAFILDEDERTLRRAGQTVALAPKAFEMLLVLVRQAGRSFSKEELMEQIWPDAFVEEANLAVHISMLRKALGEQAGGGQYIETLPRRGYRFAAAVREFNDEVELNLTPAMPLAGDSAPAGQAATAASVAASASASQRPTAPTLISYFTKPKTLIVAAIVVALAVLAYTIWPRKAPARGGRTQRLAVLPFVNKGPGGQPYDYGLALADSVINKLGLISSLIVSPTPYVERYANMDVEPEEVARQLNVNCLLMGNYIVDGDDLTVNAQLIDVEHKAQLWGGAIKGQSSKMIELQDYVAQQVVKGLRLQLTEREGARLNRSVPVDPRALADFARSRYLMSGNRHRDAIQLLNEAVQIEPNFALGWTYLARAYQINALQFSGDHRELLQAEADYQQALELDPDEAQTRVWYAKLLTETGRVEEAVPHLLALLADNPNLANAHSELSYAYRYAGLLDESLAESDRAIRIDPQRERDVFHSYLYTGQYDKFVSNLPLQETAYVTFYRGLAHYYQNDLQLAAADFDRAYKLNGTWVVSQIGRALKLGIEGDKSAGLGLLRKAEAANTRTGIGDGEIAYKFAQAFDALGNTELALRAFSRSIEQGFFCYSYFANDPLLKNVRSHAEFAALLEKARQRHEAFRRRMADLAAPAPQP
ncbi:MAG TPA: winged helix-turn-helix domain-containing protein [Blastocatellia bacterium]|nr:winged helix-turn-helix domain-containing protein [Blastocatellia bacterium]